jgi:hypothetical protein
MVFPPQVAAGFVPQVDARTSRARIRELTATAAHPKYFEIIWLIVVSPARLEA